MYPRRRVSAANASRAAGTCVADSGVRLAQVAPLYESVPPHLYGGTERIVSYLTEELLRRGHEVTLFASGDSFTQARLVAGASRALRLDPIVVDPLPYHIAQIQRVAALARRSEEHTSELQSQFHLVCRLLLEKKKNKTLPLFQSNKKKQK